MKGLGVLRERLSATLARSSRVFIAGLVVACLVEVVVDWSATLREINILRGGLRQKGENYVDILRKASESAMLAYDWDELDRLSQRVFDDDEVVYVRFSDALGNTLYDHLRPGFGKDFEAEHHRTFRAHYRHVMERDAAGLMSDPVGLQQRMAASRHRDLLQILTDGQQRLLASVTAPPAELEIPRTLYQDRLADEHHAIDRSLSYALGSVVGETEDCVGVVLIAFRNDPLNQAIRGKLEKGLAVSVFFLGLLLVQNVLSRRAKLRLLGLEASLHAARTAVRSSLSKVPHLDAWEIGAALVQSDRLGGTVYDLTADAGGRLDVLVASPDGAGVEAAFASVALRDVFARQAATAVAGNPAERLRALLHEYEAAPLGRPVELLLARAEPDGRVDGVVIGLATPRKRLDGGEVVALEREEPLALTSMRLRGEARAFTTTLGVGDALVFFDDGSRGAAPLSLDAGDAAGAQGTADRIVAAAARRQRGKPVNDLCALVLRFVRAGGARG